MPARVEVDHQVDARALGSLHHGAAVGDGGRQRLLDEHVLAGRQHRHGGLAVQVVGRGDGHGLHVARGHLVEAGRPRAAEVLGGAARGLVAIADHRDGARGCVVSASA